LFRLAVRGGFADAEQLRGCGDVSSGHYESFLEGRFSSSLRLKVSGRANERLIAWWQFAEPIS
jgi:hypothetical protein